MSRERRKPFNQEFKLAAVERMLAGENVSALARELGVARKFLYVWRDRYRAAGPGALVPQRPGPKPKSKSASPPPPREAAPAAGATEAASVDALRSARARIAELERKVGRQALELDFFRRALRHFEETRRPDDGPGVPASTRSSDR